MTTNTWEDAVRVRREHDSAMREAESLADFVLEDGHRLTEVEVKMLARALKESLE